MYSSTLSLTLDEVCGQRHVPAALPPPLPLRKLSCTYFRGGWVGPGWELKISPPTPDRPIRGDIPTTLPRPTKHNHLFSGYAGILNDQMGRTE
jgi:hypothetical protein